MEQQKQITELLESLNITCEVVLLSENILKDDNWKCDQWYVTLFNVKKNFPFSTSYYTGLGHRVYQSRTKASKGINTCKMVKTGMISQRDRARINPTAAFNYYEYVKVPSCADILYSLATCDYTDEPFDEWADNFGYDADSMKAFNTYTQCRDTTKAINKIFTRDQIEQIQEILQDY
jgi:hypothetical protein